jgi:hypothetical protein
MVVLLVMLVSLIIPLPLGRTLLILSLRAVIVLVSTVLLRRRATVVLLLAVTLVLVLIVTTLVLLRRRGLVRVVLLLREGAVRVVLLGRGLVVLLRSGITLTCGLVVGVHVSPSVGSSGSESWLPWLVVSLAGMTHHHDAYHFTTHQILGRVQNTGTGLLVSFGLRVSFP